MRCSILVALGNTSLSNCTFESGYQYCGKYYVEDATTSTDTDDSGEDAVATGSLTEDEGCTDYVDVCSGCGWDCSTILDLYDITIAQFYEWNPLVGSQCTGMQLGKQQIQTLVAFLKPGPPQMCSLLIVFAFRISILREQHNRNRRHYANILYKDSR